MKHKRNIHSGPSYVGWSPNYKLIGNKIKRDNLSFIDLKGYQ